jgi:hypothetical protein
VTDTLSSNGRGPARLSTEIIRFSGLLFRRPGATKQISPATKPFFAFRADIRKQPLAIRLPTKRRGPPAPSGDSQMRTISFILALGFVLAGPSIAGTSDNSLPGIGTFSYNGSPVTVPAAQPLVVAAK